MTLMDEARITLTTISVVFIVLKVSAVVSWSWWWVLAPVWMPFVLIISGMVLFAIGLMIRNWARRGWSE